MGLTFLWRLLWLLGWPLVMLYFLRRGRRDPAYRQHLGQRLGHGPGLPGCVWVHAVSLGEMRSAVPLVRALLDRGERVLTTHLTPAGRRASETAFAAEIAAGRVAVRYLPLELGWAYRRFLRAHRPVLALVMEIEIWPVMIAEAAHAGVPLYLCNSQYPEKSFRRDLRLARVFGHPVARVAGVLAKSERHAARFRALGAPGVQVCGELRFDQPVPEAQLVAAQNLLRHFAGRLVVTVASVVAGEEPIYLETYRLLQQDPHGLRPLFVHVPRAPELFEASAKLLAEAGFRVKRRSECLDAELVPTPGSDPGDADILLGDSLGEMYFFLALAHVVIVGGGFRPSGAHNIIEPLALRKPVLVGPSVWSIDYPGHEAASAGVLIICTDAAMLAERAAQHAPGSDEDPRTCLAARIFNADHAGATQRILAALDPVIGGPASCTTAAPQ